MTRAKSHRSEAAQANIDRLLADGLRYRKLCDLAGAAIIERVFNERATLPPRDQMNRLVDTLAEKITP